MRVTVTYPSTTELATEYSATPVSNDETDAILIKPLDVDSSATAEVGGNTQGTLFINFTKGSLTKVQIRIYGSHKSNPSSSEWYQEQVETDTTGVATLDAFIIELTATAKKAYHFPIGAYKAMKITVQSVGTTTDSAITLNCGFRTN